MMSTTTPPSRLDRSLAWFFVAPAAVRFHADRFVLSAVVAGICAALGSGEWLVVGIAIGIYTIVTTTIPDAHDDEDAPNAADPWPVLHWSDAVKVTTMVLAVAVVMMILTGNSILTARSAL